MINNYKNYCLKTVQNSANLVEIATDVAEKSYPKFLSYNLHHDEIWLSLFELYPEFQFVLTDAITECAIAQWSGIPLVWEGNFEKLPDEGCDWLCTQGFSQQANEGVATVLAVVSISIIPEYQGKGLSNDMITHIKEVAQNYKLDAILLAARPKLKHLYPLTPMERYITWQNDCGLMFDPWLRVIVRQGFRVMGICSKSTTILETISGWETRVGMRFPETDNYVIPGGLVPLKIDYANDTGTYVEPNVWLYHEL